MKKKVMMLVAVLGMALADTEINAQNERLAPPKNCKSYPSNNTGECTAGTDGGAYCIPDWFFSNCR